MPYRNTSLCRYTGVHVTTCIPIGFSGSSLLLTGTLVGLTKQRDIIGFPAPYAHSTPVCPGLGLTEIHLGPHTSVPLWAVELPMADRDRFLEGSILSVPIN